MDVTLFEVHLDGAQFGPTTIGEGTNDDGTNDGGTMASEPVESGSSDGSRSFGHRALRLVPVVVAFGVAAGYVASRRFRGGGTTVDDAESVEIAA